MPIGQSDQLDSQAGTVVAGEGTAGTPTGGVLTVQGSPSGTSLPVTAAQGAPNTVGNAWPIKVTDGTTTASIATNGDQRVSSGLKQGGTYGLVALTTANTPVEAKIGATRLANRRFLMILAEAAGTFYGFNSSVTITTGIPLANAQSVTFDIDPDSTFQIWVVCNANSKNFYCMESP